MGTFLFKKIMSTIPEVIYSIREALKQYMDDSELDDRYILSKINMSRSIFLRQELNNLQKIINNSITQTLCLKMEIVDAGLCGINTGCEKVLRSVKPIPQPLDLDVRSAIISVRPSKRTGQPFNFVNKHKALQIQYAPFHNSIFAFLDYDNHIILVSNNQVYKLIECVNVEGIFFNPLELKDYNSCCNDDNTVCFNEETTQYPITPHHLKLVIDDVFSSIAGKELLIPEDKQNDANDTIKN